MFAQTGAPGSPLYAFDELLKAATAAGVQEKDVTLAILEGRIHPKLEDLKLAEMGVGGSKQWNVRFGSMMSLSSVKTIVRGKPAKYAGKDLVLRIFAVMRGFAPVGVPPEQAVSYEKTRALIPNKNPDLIAFLDGTLDSLGYELSVVTYFAGEVSLQLAGFRTDYEALPSLGAAAPIRPLISSAAPPSAPTAETVPTIPAKSGDLARSAIVVSAAAKACDALAAHPDDKGKTNAGVMDEKINAALAIERCSIAAQQEPQSGRLHFQLGRAYWKAEKYDEALEAFLKAEELEYAPAYFYIGMAYEDGLIEGEKADLAMAREMYMIAAAEGFEPAIKAYADFEEVVPPVDVERLNTLARVLYENRFDELSDLAARVPPVDFKGSKYKITEPEFRQIFLSYMVGVDQFMAQNPNSFDAACPSLHDKETAAALDRWTNVDIFGLPAAPSGNNVKDFIQMGRNLSERAQRSGGILGGFRLGITADAGLHMIQQGTDDAYDFVMDYGGCNGEAVKRFYGNMKRYVLENAPKAPARGTR